MPTPWVSMCVNGHKREGRLHFFAVGAVSSYSCAQCLNEGLASMRWSVPPDADYDTQLAYAKLFASRQQETS